MRNFLDAKAMAKSLRLALAEQNIRLSHSACLELVARQFGFGEWNMLAARLGDISPEQDRLYLPKDWIISGPAINGTTHRFGLDPSASREAIIESLVEREQAPDLTGRIAVLMQSVEAESYRGRRLKLSADLKAAEADCGTIWMRVDSVGRPAARFDNMLGRSNDGPLVGTHDWTTRAIVLDVPDDAESLHYGFFLKGYGKVWARSFDLQVIDDQDEPTARHSQHLAQPSNLDFSETSKPAGPLRT